MILALDGRGIACRAFYAQANAYDGFTRMVARWVQELKPSKWLSAWEDGKTFRHDIYPEYKAHRKPTPESLLNDFEEIYAWCDKIGLPRVSRLGFEADDVLASVAREADHRGEVCVIVTDDKDLMQMVGDRVSLLRPARQKEGLALTGEFEVIEEWGVPPQQMADVLALMGDASDNVPGVPGIGERGAKTLIAEYGCLNDLYVALGAGEKMKHAAALDHHRDKASLSRRLVALRDDLDVADLFTLMENPKYAPKEAR